MGPPNSGMTPSPMSFEGKPVGGVGYVHNGFGHGTGLASFPSASQSLAKSPEGATGAVAASNAPVANVAEGEKPQTTAPPVVSRFNDRHQAPLTTASDFHPPAPRPRTNGPFNNVHHNQRMQGQVPNNFQSRPQHFVQNQRGGGVFGYQSFGPHGNGHGAQYGRGGFGRNGYQKFVGGSGMKGEESADGRRRSFGGPGMGRCPLCDSCDCRLLGNRYFFVL